MPSRFEFERAIRRSGLPPLSRLLALTIATWADADTGSIAHRNQPAQSVLLEATGMSKSSFLTHRKNLLDGGWVRCDSPDPIKAQKEHAQNVYFIQIPDGKAGSGDDPAKSGKRPGKRHEPRSGDDLALGRETTQPKGTETAKSGSNLGRLPTTRVLPSPISSLPTGEGEQASSEERTPRAFDYCQPLIKAMTEAGIYVSWQMTADDWQAVARILDRAGVEQMVKFAAGTKAREPIRFAKFFLKAGWVGLPPRSTRPQPAADKPPHCGHPDCDPITRTRETEDARGIRSLNRCPECHPNTKGRAA
ncbi:hypothetical protein GCM10011583_18420 [Streptomyces camponoticapitis]|uniref:Uncharacterized protein n=1 Tax=Streptomyces camponoticapitis TaxID=1616125 RepID=A0ABQ2E1G6_9ACTN|nr:hypothetical protein [Streptomyces camponoticapitis]GGJ87189.1 hypothetical protein GCM10011583_18420 [Streptomyces camponoticapitis]